MKAKTFLASKAFFVTAAIVALAGLYVHFTITKGTSTIAHLSGEEVVNMDKNPRARTIASSSLHDLSHYQWTAASLPYKKEALSKSWKKVTSPPHKALEPYQLVRKLVEYDREKGYERPESLFNAVYRYGGVMGSDIYYYWFRKGTSTLRSPQDLATALRPIDSGSKAVALVYFSKNIHEIKSDQWTPDASYLQVADGYLVRIILIHDCSHDGPLETEQILQVSSEGKVSVVASYATQRTGLQTCLSS